jgi:hypothetical protein
MMLLATGDYGRPASMQPTAVEAAVRRLSACILPAPDITW